MYGRACDGGRYVGTGGFGRVGPSDGGVRVRNSPEAADGKDLAAEDLDGQACDGGRWVGGVCWGWPIGGRVLEI